MNSAKLKKQQKKLEKKASKVTTLSPKKMKGLKKAQRKEKTIIDDNMVVSPDIAMKNIATIPIKNPPCKKCPALKLGLCKCAVKKFKIAR
ncbi:hypothetical protein ACXJY6_10710 [Vibrio sp. RC27]